MSTTALPHTLLRAVHVMVLAGVVGVVAVAGAPATTVAAAAATTTAGPAPTALTGTGPTVRAPAVMAAAAMAPPVAADAVTAPMTVGVPVVAAQTATPVTAASIPAPAPATAAPVVMAVVVPAAAPVTPTPAGSGVPATAARAVFGATNTFRDENGVPALVWNAALQRSAHQHNLAMAAANQMSHQLPGEASSDTRISDQGVPWLSVGENVGYNTDHTVAGAVALHTMMINEVAPNDDHKVNKLDPKFTTLGVDVYIDPTTGTLWLTEDYAQI